MNVEEQSQKGPIAWMVKNPVTANLCMLFFIFGGLIFASRIRQEVFPEVELDIVQVSVVYPAASPAEIEQGIILSIEDEVRSVEGVKRVTSIALEDRGLVSAELLLGEDPSKLLQDIKNRVDSIQSFPEEAERPIVNLLEPRRQVISLIVYGGEDIKGLRDLSEKMREDLAQLPGVTLVDIPAAPSYLIAIEIPIEKLREYDLTLDAIANVIKDTAVEIPAGGIKSSTGEMLLRVQERRDFAREFFDIPILVNPDGSNLLLGEIAKLKDGFSDTDQESYFNGKKAVKIDIFRVGDQRPLDVAETVKEFVKKEQVNLPEGIHIVTWNDRSAIYQDRISLLLRNAQLGLFLVLGLLTLFLEPRLAFWVTLGLPVSIVGSFLFIPLTGATINMVSLFAFIVTLGIIVDDAIVVGENIYQKLERGMPHMQAAIEGAREMSVPVCFAVLTNIVAFLPLFFIPGSTGKIFLQIPAIVVSVFVVSLIESLFILPSHLSKEHKDSRLMKLMSYPNHFVNLWGHKFTTEVFAKYLQFAVKHRYFTSASFIGLFIFFLGLIWTGYISFSYLPRVDSDTVSSQVILPFGVPIERSREVQQILIDTAKEVIAENGGEKIAKGIFTQIGTSLTNAGPGIDAVTITEGTHLVGAQISLVPSDQRDISGIEFARKWSQKVGGITDAESVSFDATIAAGEGMPINIELSHPNQQELEFAAKDVGEFLTQYKGVSEVDDGVTKGKPQLSFKMTPTARSLGLTAGEVARQIRSAFYGAEALRQQRDRHEVKVLVRLPKEQRRSLETIDDFIILAPKGGEIPLSEAVDMESSWAYTQIKRTDGRRVIAVTSDVDETVANANKIIEDVEENVLPQMQKKYPGLTYTLQGQLRAQRESLEAMRNGFLVTMVAIYIMLAIPFQSYSQPFVVMLSIPFGFIGAILGHIFLGYELSIISIFGLVALGGVIVNDSLVLVVTTNNLRKKEKLSAFDAISTAAQLRLRPILLTSLTTFFGLSPMIFETSMQARFLIPMAISLGFGVLFGTFIILLVVPSVYLIIEDIKSLVK